MTAAAGFLIMFSMAMAPTAACGAHSVKKANVTTSSDDMPRPAVLLSAYVPFSSR